MKGSQNLHMQNDRIVEEGVYKGCKYVIEYDDCGSGNPREDDNLGVIYYTSTRYKLGDEQVSREELKDITEDVGNICVPVYAYIHSGITVSTGRFNCPWDSGQCGYIVCTHEKAKREFYSPSDAKPDDYVAKAIRCMEGEIKTFDLWVRGNVYHYSVSSPEGWQLDSCGGILAERVSEVVSMAKEEIDYFDKNRKDYIGGGYLMPNPQSLPNIFLVGD